jgi:hypothetical protein
MSRVNPFYIVAFLLFILVFAFVKLSSLKTEYTEVKSEYRSVSSLASELVGLKKVYGSSQKSKKALQRILRNNILKSAEITQKNSKSSIKLSSNSMEKRALNTLLGKILNATYNITSFKIRRLSDTHVSFEMEIKW